MSETEIKKQDFAQTLARGLTLPRSTCGRLCTGERHRNSQNMNVHRASARRVLLTLESLGYVREERGLFSASSTYQALGRASIRQQATGRQFWRSGLHP
jgi:IclR family pca regulon transcriptional regulator